MSAFVIQEASVFIGYLYRASCVAGKYCFSSLQKLALEALSCEISAQDQIMYCNPIYIIKLLVCDQKTTHGLKMTGGEIAH